MSIEAYEPSKNDVEGGGNGGGGSWGNVNLLEEAGGPKKNTCSLDTETKELARWGSFVTTKIDVEQSCPRAAHPSDMHSFKTVNRLSGSEMKLTDFFRDEDIYKAMMDNKDIQDALGKAGEYPKNFDELEKVLYAPGPGVSIDATPMGENYQGPEKIEGYLNEDALKNFAFYEVVADHDSAQIKTRVLMDYGAEASRNSLPYVDLYLPMPNELQQAKQIFKADSLDQGFLMKDSKQYGAGSYKHEDIPNPFE